MKAAAEKPDTTTASQPSLASPREEEMWTRPWMVELSSRVLTASMVPAKVILDG